VLSLDSRTVGKVGIVRCSGRIVGGTEADCLREHINTLLEGHSAILLHLGEVDFIDSSGLGMLVRLLTSIRRAGGDLKLCHLPNAVHNALRVTNLITIFDAHDSEERGVSAFYEHATVSKQRENRGPRVLCVDRSADVLALLREVLRGAGFDVLTNSNLSDSLILIRATRPTLIILGPNLSASSGTQHSFRSACSATSVIELGNEFSSVDAAQAASSLLHQIRTVLEADS
jgi:anti-sigma B factor antagonist